MWCDRRPVALYFVVLVVVVLVVGLVPVTNGLAATGGDRFKKKFQGGAGVGRLVIDTEVDSWQCHYDMVLCERIQGKPQPSSGLYIPAEDLPRLHLCRVISLGPGREEENGRIAPMPLIKVGDIVVAKNPWGIGPKDEETVDGKKLSFMRSQDIAAVITGGLVPEEENLTP